MPHGVRNDLQTDRYQMTERKGETVTVSRGSPTVVLPSGRWVVVSVGVAHGPSDMPANAALRCQSSEATWSSLAAGDGIAGIDS